MQVETYEVEGLNTTNAEICEEWQTMISDLGLTGQEKLRAKTESGEAALCPYRTMTRDERFAYEVMLPTKVSVHDYTAGPIPVRVLQVLQHAKSLRNEEGKPMFGCFRVWSNDSEPDPILVAHTGESSWSSDPYLLARWGESLISFSEVMEYALKRRSMEYAAKLREAANEIAGLLENLKRGATPDMLMQPNGSPREPYFNK